jgi:type IV pilus assembly protein PilY1
MRHFSIRSVLVSIAAASLLLAIGNGNADAAMFNGEKPFRPFIKKLFTPDDTIAKGYPPNVLLLVDTGSPMLWTPRGKIPNCDTDSADMSSIYAKMAQCTWGSGALPWTVPFGTTQYRYGRDLDASNNDPESADCYYYPDPSYRYKLVFKDSRYWQTPKINPTTNDLVPNDSRLYMSKLVLWRILNEIDLVKGMNIGLATGYQEHTDNMAGIWADFYRKDFFDDHRGPDWATCCSGGTYYCYRDAQNVRWGVYLDLYKDTSALIKRRIGRAFLRVPISEHSTDHIASLLKYMDGVEQTESGSATYSKIINDELIADGKTPLADSIYFPPSEDALSTGGGTTRYQKGAINVSVTFSQRILLGAKQAVGCVRNFFYDRVVKGSCQKNWLVVFTAGDDSTGGAKAEDSVRNLYRSTKTLLDVNGKILSMDDGVRTMVVGFVDPDSTDPQVVKLRTTLTNMAQEGQPLANGDRNPNVRPYFANDVPGLVSALKSVFTSIGASNYAGAAPVVLPPKTPETDGIVFNSTFTIDKNGNWSGTFSKATLNIETNIYTDVWEAGKKMPSASKRNLLTVDWDPAGTKAAPKFALNCNCCVLNVSTETGNPKPPLSNEIWSDCDNSQADLFIRWLRGEDYNVSTKTYVQRTNPLLDMEHSGVTVVKDPAAQYSAQEYQKFKTDNSGRDPVVYIQSNGGILHAFDFSSGVEKWGFLPPNVVHFNRLARLRFPFDDGVSPSNLTPKLSMSATTFPVYLLDGSLVAEDVSLLNDPHNPGNPGFGTVLVGSLGYGGCGIYAMNVTKPSLPQFMWGIENQMSYGEKLVYRWVPKSTTDAVAADVYVTPHASPLSGFDYRRLGMTMSVPAVGYVRNSPSDSWVLIVGAGMNQNLASRDVADVGKAIYVSSIENAAIVREFVANNVVGSLTGDPDKLGMALAPISAYVATPGGPLEEAYTSDHRGHIFRINLATGSASTWTMRNIFTLKSDTAVLSFTKPIVIPHALELGFFGGDMWVFGGTADVRGPDFKVISNDRQYIFGFNSKISDDVSLTKEDLYAVAPTSDSSFLGDATSVSQGKRAGWYMPLQQRNAASKKEAEYASTPPLLINGALLIATFIPTIEDVDDQCQVGGTSRLYVVDAATSKGLWDKTTVKRYVELSGIKISGLTSSRGKLFLGIKELNPGFDPSTVEGGILKNSLKRGGVLVFDLPEGIGSGGSTGSVLPDKQKVQYWREIFR